MRIARPFMLAAALDAAGAVQAAADLVYFGSTNSKDARRAESSGTWVGG